MAQRCTHSNCLRTHVTWVRHPAAWDRHAVVLRRRRALCGEAWHGVNTGKPGRVPDAHIIPGPTAAARH